MPFTALDIASNFHRTLPFRLRADRLGAIKNKAVQGGFEI
jgi:hypothetical protein